MDLIETDLAVVGAGSAGLSVAVGATQMGARVLLIERGRMGGECLHSGCIPSKSLLAIAGRVREAGRASGELATPAAPPANGYGRARAHLRDVVEGIAPHDSEARMTGLGIKVLRGSARFVGPGRIAVDGTPIAARRIVLATGSRPHVPSIPGLAGLPYLTNETVFELADLPRHLLILGGGPMGIELAQAFRRLGSTVTLLARGKLLSRHDPEAVEVVRQELEAEGVALQEGIELRSFRGDAGAIEAEFTRAGDPRCVSGSHLLVAAGRVPAVEGLDLEQGRIAHGLEGITVDRRLRTSHRRVFAIGDAVGPHRFTHMASHHASVVLQNALLAWPATVAERAVPSVVYADPELAQVGVTEAGARSHGLRVETVSWPFSQNDRARTESRTEGFVKLVINRRGRPIGATIVGAQAGELIQPWCLAIQERLPLRKIAQAILPYPTLGEASKQAAGRYFAPTLFGPRIRRFVRLVQRLP